MLWYYVSSGQERIPVRSELPAGLPPGRYELRLKARFSTGEVQEEFQTRLRAQAAAAKR